MHIQRCLKPSTFGTIKVTELHHFSDASSTGYGQWSYFRLVDDQNNVHYSFIMSKSRVMHMKPMTIPRLELTAALVSVRISSILRSELSLPNVEEFFWTDSQVALGYISNDSRRFHVFVANRIQQIRECTSPNQWNYVNSSVNPADIASRSFTARELLRSKWLAGPEFLCKIVVTTNKVEEANFLPAEDDSEVRKVKALAVDTKSSPADSSLQRIEYFSDWYRTKRAFANCLKLKSKFQDGSVKTRHFSKKSTSELVPQYQSPTVNELLMSEKEIIRLVQSEAFAEEISVLSSTKTLQTKRNKFVKRCIRISRLNPFIDEDGIIRVGGRIRRMKSKYEEKHPAILTRRHHVTTVIIRHFHEKIQHQGHGMTVNEIRTNGYWILGCSSAVSNFGSGGRKNFSRLFNIDQNGPYLVAIFSAMISSSSVTTIS